MEPATPASRRRSSPRATTSAASSRAECTRKTADLAPFEQIRWAGVLPRDLTIEDGELTPTLKVKRRVVELRYASLVVEFDEPPTL